jgi:iron complex outermembrane receptor protein
LVCSRLLTEGNLFEDDVAVMNGRIAFAKADLGRLAKLVLPLVVLSGLAFAQEQDLTQLSLEDLMNTKVTSISKKEQSLSRAAAAIFVITAEDVRRSGATSIPDLLRMVPGLDVAQINANSWAISARGFNHQFSDKLLVLIDGRTVYTPLFAGVYWDVQDVPLEDIERIEVIRGPGATVWGANAVNGVINIITKSAADTQGGLLVAGGGTQDLALGTAQYGGKVGKDASYRVFTKYLDHNHFSDLTGQDGEDGWHLSHAGFRTDASLSQKDSLTVEGDLYGGSEGANYGHIVSIAPPVNENLDGTEELSGGNILSRWNHAFSRRSDTTLQFYFDRYERDGPVISDNRGTFDVDFQHHLALGYRHDLIWGADYRYSSDYTEGTIDRAWVPAGRALQLFSTFAQDEIVLKPDRVFLTVGTKLENNYYSGWDLDPSARVAWTPSKQHSFWAAVSRADRTPDRRNEDADINIAAFPGPGGVPALLTLLGNPNEESEHVVAYEAGYRAQPAGPFSIDVATFFNTYTDLATTEPGSPFLVANPAPAHLVFPLVWGNLMHGTTYGIEVSANWKVNDRWTLSPGYTLLQMHLHTDATSQDTTTLADTEGSSPRHQAQLRSHLKLPGRFVWDVSGYFVERLSAQAVPSYTRMDTQVSRQLGERLEFSLVGQNLLQDHHLESHDDLTSVNPTQMKRSAYAKIVWRFW